VIVKANTPAGVADGRVFMVEERTAGLEAVDRFPRVVKEALWDAWFPWAASGVEVLLATNPPERVVELIRTGDLRLAERLGGMPPVV
jgi:hypothetical protein